MPDDVGGEEIFEQGDVSGTRRGLSPRTESLAQTRDIRMFSHYWASFEVCESGLPFGEGIAPSC